MGGHAVLEASDLKSPGRPMYLLYIHMHLIDQYTGAKEVVKCG